MFERQKLASVASIRVGMEVITADGKRAGYVVTIESGEIVTRDPERHLPLTWIRRIDDDVHISARSQQLRDPGRDG